MPLFKFAVDETKCMNCGACMDLCPPTCIEFKGNESARRN
ncbi:MAG: 4Fe-4S binding protein [Nitrososphaerota archaeon]|nr:4Fe-4S binding protein [Nitrososphaerota archaeon]